MINRTAYLCLRIAQDAFQLSPIIEHFEEIRIGLEYPGTSSVKLLSEAGEQLNSDRVTLLSHLRVRKVIHFQWWRSDCEDVYCRIRFAPGRTMLEFGIEGVTPDEEEMLLNSFYAIAKHYVSNGLLAGFVLDYSEADMTMFDSLFAEK